MKTPLLSIREAQRPHPSCELRGRARASPPWPGPVSCSPSSLSAQVLPPGSARKVTRAQPGPELQLSTGAAAGGMRLQG